MKFITTIFAVFIFSCVAAFSQFIAFTSSEAFPAAKNSAIEAIGSEAKLTFVGHLLETIPLSMGGTSIQLPSDFSIETGKANFWFYSFKAGDQTYDVGIINSAMVGGFYAMSITISDYFDLSTMVDLSATIADDQIVNSADMGQYFTQNSEFMTKFNGFNVYETVLIGLYTNGPLDEFDQGIYWGYWFIPEAGDKEVCALKIENKELTCNTIVNITETSEIKISISPNPASDILNISNTEFATEYTITNYYGEIVANGKLSEGRNSININDLSSGMYFVQLSNDNGMIKAEKVIVR